MWQLNAECIASGYACFEYDRYGEPRNLLCPLDAIALCSSTCLMLMQTYVVSSAGMNPGTRGTPTAMVISGDCVTHSFLVVDLASSSESVQRARTAHRRTGTDGQAGRRADVLDGKVYQDYTSCRILDIYVTYSEESS
jgi:hypothetical protein